VGLERTWTVPRPPPHATRMIESRERVLASTRAKSHPWGEASESETMRLLRLLKPRQPSSRPKRTRPRPPGVAHASVASVQSPPSVAAIAGSAEEHAAISSRQRRSRLLSLKRVAHDAGSTFEGPHFEACGDDVVEGRVTQSSRIQQVPPELPQVAGLGQASRGPSISQRAAQCQSASAVDTSEAAESSTCQLALVPSDDASDPPFAAAHGKPVLRKQRFSNASKKKSGSKFGSRSDAVHVPPQQNQEDDTEVTETIAQRLSKLRESYDPGFDCDLFKAARDMSMSVDEVIRMKHIFDEFDSNASGVLDVDEFEAAVAKLLQAQMQDEIDIERLRSIREWCWWEADVDRSGSIDFTEFLNWYSSNGFNEDMLLTDRERNLRLKSVELNLDLSFVDSAHQCFERCDTNGSGQVDYSEFKSILHKLLKVPANVDVPEQRIQSFFEEMVGHPASKSKSDVRTCTADFDQFIAWWMKYFGENESGFTEERSSQWSPLEEFYRIRRLGWRHMDPIIDTMPHAPDDDDDET